MDVLCRFYQRLCARKLIFHFARWGGHLSFKHRSNKETTALSYETALLVQALKTLGQDRIDDNVLHALCEKIEPKDITRAVREAQYVTSWVYATLRRLAAEKERSHA